MAVHRIKKLEELEAERPGGRAAEAADSDSEDDLLIPDTDTRPYEPDPREVDSVTDRIFAAVLSRYGWAKTNGRLEHVGARQHARR